MMPSQQQQLVAHLQHYCPEGWQAVQHGHRAASLPQLTTADKAAIYYYTDDGYEALNRTLHANHGRNTSIFGQGLAAALAKLPAYVGLAYSGVSLQPEQFRHYHAQAQAERPVSWPAFLSGSSKITIARQYLRSSKNCLFTIQSRTGRPIEQLSKFGISGQNECEILFAPNTQFEVLEIANETGYVHIVLNEL